MKAKQKQYAIGVDYGTNSVRALVVEGGHPVHVLVAGEPHARHERGAFFERTERGGKAEPEAKSDDNGIDSWAMKDSYDSPLELLRDVWNNPKAPKGIRYQAAKDALPYLHARMEGGKKEEKEKGAKGAAKGKFQPGNRPSMYQ